MFYPLTTAVAVLRWEHWIIPAVGMASAALTLAVVASILRRPKVPVFRPVNGQPPPPDPFLEGSATERRTTFRRSGNPIEVSIAAAEPAGEIARGRVVDRSMGGLCLITTQPIDKGTIISVRPLNAPPPAQWVQVQVRGCRQDGKEWELGCQFLRTPPYSVLLSFG